MIINQSYASDKISTLTRSLSKKLEAEAPGIGYRRELIADGEAFIASHAERFISIKVANGIELSTWRYMCGDAKLKRSAIELIFPLRRKSWIISSGLFHGSMKDC